jgi:hypothetical protein
LNIVGTNALSNSSEWKFGDEVEWSIDMESEFFVKSLSLRSLCFIKIDNIPLLGFGSVVAPNLNWVSFFVLTISNIKGFVVVPVDELVVLILEYLPPS